MDKRELIKRSLDTSNAMISTAAEATAVNPNIWDMKLREFQQANLVLTPQAEQFDFRGPGTDYRVTIDEEPSAASSLVETTDISVSKFSTRKVTFDPKEYGAGYQVTRKEAVRAFFDVAERMTKKLGYSLALKKDNLAYSLLRDSANSTIFPNSVSEASSLSSTDVLDYETINKANRLIEKEKYQPVDAFLSYNHKEQLLNEEKVHKADNFGTRSAIAQGLLGTLFGLRLWISHSVVSSTTADTDTDVEYAIVAGQTGTGEKAFGYAIKRDPMIEREYHARGRYWDIVAHEEYDFQMLHPKAVVAIGTYVASE